MNWWQRCRRWITGRVYPRYRATVVQDTLPAHLRRSLVYLVEDDGYAEQAAMLCPCGCGQVLHMNLLTDERPCWKAVVHEDGTLTLHPSVWRKVGCKSHFWLREGKVQWCDQPPPVWRRLLWLFAR